MPAAFDRASLITGLAAIADHMEACQDELNHADAQLGDGDLGVTMSRGMASVRDKLDDLPQDMGMALLAVAKCFTQISGSSYGTLLATGLLAAAKQTKGQSIIACTEVAGLCGVALAAMMQRGKASLDDKTVLDMLSALEQGLTDIADSKQLAQASRHTCKQALDDYRDKQAKQGRARMFGDKSKGLDDPGMLALSEVITALTATTSLGKTEIGSETVAS